MSSFVKCKICPIDVECGKCVFAVYRKVVGGKKYFFCCGHLAGEFGKK